MPRGQLLQGCEGSLRTTQQPVSVLEMPALFSPTCCEECLAMAPNYAATGHAVTNVHDDFRATFEIWLHAERRGLEWASI